MNQELFALVMTISSNCIQISEEHNKECAQFIYQNNELGAPTLGGKFRTSVWPAPGKNPVALLHTHRHKGVPKVSKLDIALAKKYATACDPIRLFIFSYSGDVTEFTDYQTLDKCKNLKNKTNKKTNNSKFKVLNTLQ